MRRFNKITRSLLHGFWMICLVFMWIRQPFILDYEFDIARDFKDVEWAMRLGESKFKDDYKDKFFYINTAHSLSAVENAPSHWPSNVITDRSQILSLLKQLNTHKDLYDLAFFDVFIDELYDETDEEIRSLISQLKKSEKIITVNHINDNYNTYSTNFFTDLYYDYINKKLSLEPNIFGTDLSGPVYYPLSTSQAFYKIFFQFKLDKTYHKQAPILAYEILRHKKAKKPFLFSLFYKYEGKKGIFQNIFEPRMVIGPDDMNNIFVPTKNGLKEEIQLKENLNTLATDDTTFLGEYLQKYPGKIIIIGDLSYADFHFTMNGQTVGPLIFVNSFIALNEETNRLTTIYLLYLLLSFSLVSYFTFYPHTLDKALKKKPKNKWLASFKKFIINRANYLILLLATLLGIFVFNQYIFLFFNLIYVFLLELIFKFKEKNLE